MTIGDLDVHHKFKLNGRSYTNVTLKELANNLAKEGRSFERAIGSFLSDWLNDTHSLEVKTSGSTGIPKSILLQKSQMVNSARATGEYFDLKAEDTALLCLSADYIAGKMMLVRAMILGLELEYAEPNSNPLVGVDKTYDFAAMVPLQLQNSLNEIEQVKTLIVGGASMSVSLKKSIQNKKTAIFETYGMTETITHVAVKKTNGLNKQSRNHFSALPNVKFQTDDRDCLLIDAPRVSDEMVLTNDIVHLVSNKEFEWLGRYDNVINSGGVKLFPEQIEAKLAAFIEQSFFVAGVKDESLGQKLVLLVEGISDAEDILTKINKIDAFERFEIPKSVYCFPKFVTTASGKIRRAETLKLLQR